MIGNNWKKRVAVILSLGLILGLLQVTSVVAAKKPTVAKTVAVEPGCVERLKINSNGYKIKKVTAVASNSNVGVVSITKKSIIINGITEGDAQLVITIKAKKKKKTHTFSLITSVMVVKLEGQGGEPTSDPGATAAPGVTQSPYPVASGTPLPNVSQAPVATASPNPSSTASPSSTGQPAATSTPTPASPTASPSADPSAQKLRVEVKCKTGLSDMDVAKPITKTLIENEIIDSIRLYDKFDNPVGLDKVKSYEYNAYHDSACTKPYDEGNCLEGGESYIQVKVFIADEYRKQYADSTGVGKLVLKTEASG